MAMVRRVLRLVWVAAGLSFLLWMYVGFQALGTAADAAKGDAVVRTSEGLHFRPEGSATSAGLIFLPGGMVEPEAYAPLLRDLARAGYNAHLLYLPMRVAFTDSQITDVFDRIDKLLSQDPQTRWVLAGHSRGGMLASRYVNARRPSLAGLVLIGTTHPRDFSLAETAIPITKVYGTRDEVASYASMRENQHLVPANTAWIGIEGGNHVQFGYYRHQLGDGSATISREEQQRQLVAALTAVLSSAEKR